MSASLEVVADPARECAALLESIASEGGQLVLAGGSTPRAAYEQAGGSWERATVWFGDERCVPPDDLRSNYRMACESLLDRVRPAVVHRIQGELGPDRAAEAYERLLRDSGRAGGILFELVLLGLGADGHTASLFPDQESLFERSRLAVGVPHPGLEPFVPRVTLTLPALAAARRVVFLVTGPTKADAVAKAFGPGARPDPHVPASLLPSLAGDVTVLLDSAAAGGAV